MLSRNRMAKLSKVGRISGKKLLSIALLVMIAASLGGCGLFPEEEEVLAPPLVKPKEEEYQLVEVKRGDIVNKLQVTGSLVAAKDHPLSYEQGGRLDEILVKNGDTVKKGDVVARLDVGDLETQIEQAKISVAQAEVSLREAKDKLNRSKKNLSNVQSAVSKAKSDLKTAKDNLAKAESELAKAQQEWEAAKGIDPESEETKAAEKKVENAQGAVDAARAAVANLQKAVDNGPQDIENARNVVKDHEYNVERAELSVEAAKINLDKLQKQAENADLKSPIDGKVVFVDLKVRKGDVVQPYQTLVQVADPNDLEIVLDAKRLSDPHIVKTGMKAELVINQQELEGEVVSSPSSVPDEVDEENKDVIIFRVDKLPEDAEMGDTVSISITLEKKENVLIMPLQALRSYMGRNYVYILEDGSKREVNVEVGIKSATEIEVVSGLEEGQQVILR
ncbi:MAG: biotin/lipoyl-binding protein [Clostridia bacterium]|jgi:macrolide-specific efflux system membrane fusion protein